MEHFNMEKFAKGAFTVQVNREIENVLNNIADPNTDAKAKRKITVTIELSSNDNRDFITTSVTAQSKLAPALGAVTAISMGKDLKTGRVEAQEIGNQIPGQMSMEVEEDIETIEVMDKVVDPSTGEIFERPVQTQPGKVVNLRSAREA